MIGWILHKLSGKPTYPPTIEGTVARLQQVCRLLDTVDDVRLDPENPTALRIRPRGATEDVVTYANNLHDHLQHVGSEHRRWTLTQEFAASMFAPQGLPGAHLTEETLATILPVLRLPLSPDIPARPIEQPYCGEVILSLVLDNEMTTAYITDEMLEETEYDSDYLLWTAKQNLKYKAQNERILVDHSNAIKQISWDGYYESSLPLEPNFWNSVAADLSGPPIIAIPARDICLFVDSDDANAVDALRTLVATMHDVPRPITTDLWIRSGDGWRLH